VVDSDGSPLPEVTVQLTPDQESVITGPDGTFAFGELPSGRYTVRPLRSNYTFSPTGRSVTLSGEDVDGIEFIGQEMAGPPQTFALRGSVRTEEGEPLGGVRVTVEPSAVPPVTTDADGRYAFPKLPKGTYTIRPDKAGYTFDPTEITISLTGDVSGRDFVATLERPDVQRVEIRTRLPWERWYDFYGDVLDPLMSIGAEILIDLQLTAEAEQEMGKSLLERLRDSLEKYDENSTLDAS
jgi:hypothetical protein